MPISNEPISRKVLIMFTSWLSVSCGLLFIILCTTSETFYIPTLARRLPVPEIEPAASVRTTYPKSKRSLSHKRFTQNCNSVATGETSDVLGGPVQLGDPLVLIRIAAKWARLVLRGGGRPISGDAGVLVCDVATRRAKRAARVDSRSGRKALGPPLKLPPG
ncbi:hypothetical protein MTO96_009948 [Rhipicephalus appendiculatus]